MYKAQLITGNIVILVFNFIFCSALNQEVRIVFKIFVGSEWFFCLFLIFLACGAPLFFQLKAKEAFLIVWAFAKVFLLIFNIIFCLFLFYIVIINSGALQSKLFQSPFFDIIKDFWTIEQRGGVFDKLTREFPEHSFTALEKIAIIKGSCHPEIMRQNMQNCVDKHNAWGLGKTFYRLGSWVGTLDPMTVIIIGAGLAVPSYFLINKFLEAGIVQSLFTETGLLKGIVSNLFVGATKTTEIVAQQNTAIVAVSQNVDALRSLLIRSTCSLEFLMNTIHFLCHENENILKAPENSLVKSTLKKAKTLILQMFQQLEYDPSPNGSKLTSSVDIVFPGTGTPLGGTPLCDGIHNTN